MALLKEEHNVEARLMDTFSQIVEVKNRNLLQENANVDGQSLMGKMGKFASESGKFYAMEKLLHPSVKRAIEENYIHPHDFDFYPTGTTTCCQIPLGELLKNGFNTGHGHMREPSSITSALALASIIFQANQNMQHGVQSFPMFDFDLAPYVRKTYEKHLEKLKSYPILWTEDEVKEEAWAETERDVYQACEAFIHNSNSMHSRGGGQVPFVSINYGTDTSKEGRLLVKNLLLATQSGLGKGETPIFPIQIFKMKKGINFHEGDPNYDLYQLALETMAKQLFPNFSFIDSTFNAQYYDGTPESEVSYMGCRTRVMSNIHGDENSIRRGNLSFTSINHVKIALTTKTVEKFMEKLHNYIDIAILQLLERFRFQVVHHHFHNQDMHCQLCLNNHKLYNGQRDD